MAYINDSDDALRFKDNEDVERLAIHDDSTVVVNGSAVLTTLGGTLLDDLDADGNSIVGALNVEIDGALNHDGTTVGFYGTTPHTKPVVPLTTPDAQDVIDALLLLGLIAQSD